VRSVEGDFLADGAVCVWSALTTDDMERVARLFSDVVQRPGTLAMRLYSEGGARIYTDLMNVAFWPRDLEFDSPTAPIGQAVRSLLEGLPAARRRQYLEDNFLRAYPAVDRASLDDLVRTVCPTASELGLRA
jgi:hypothetical protein